MNSFSGQGQTYEYVSIFDIDGTRIFFDEISGNNAGEIGEDDSSYWNFSSEWKFVEDSNRSLLDINVIKTGTIWDEERDEKRDRLKVKPINETTTYIFDEELGVYVKECK